MQSRYYNPEWGRFINADAVAGHIGELLGQNLFAYCKNNPVNMSDPSGYLAEFDWEREDKYEPSTLGDALASVATFGLFCVSIAQLFMGNPAPMESVIEKETNVVTRTVTPAARFADKVRSLPASQRPNTVAVVKTSSGRYYAGVNSGGVINPQVQNALSNIGLNQYQGQCAEVNAISRALNKGANLNGATISISNVRGINSANGMHGTFKPPCSTCGPLIKIFNLEITGGN